MTSNAMGYPYQRSHRFTSATIWLSVWVYLTSATSIIKELCQWESFNASCGGDQVIAMEMALYGRMEIGRCVDQNYGYLGCSIGVLSHVDSLCSGRHHCKFIIPDETLRAVKPCPKDFALYLRASYTCVTVETGDRSRCRGGQPVSVRAVSGYLASVVTADRGLGSGECPWRIQVPAGQRVNVSLLDFHVTGARSWNDVTDDAPGHCQSYAVISEPGMAGKTTVCRGNQRVRFVYLSRTRTVDVQLVTYTLPKKKAHFMLKYEAVGCPSLEAPKYAHLTIDGDIATIRCNRSRTRWYMKCSGNKWVGQIGNCTEVTDVSSDNLWASIGEDWSSPFGVLLVSVFGVVLGLIIGIAMLFIVILVLKRHRRGCCAIERKNDEDVVFTNEAEHPYTMKKQRNSSAILVDQVELLNIDESGNYGTTWKTRPPCYIAHVTDSQLPAQTVIHSFHPDTCSTMKAEVAEMKFATYSPTVIYQKRSPAETRHKKDGEEEDLEND